MYRLMYQRLPTRAVFTRTKVFTSAATSSRRSWSSNEIYDVDEDEYEDEDDDDDITNIDDGERPHPNRSLRHVLEADREFWKPMRDEIYSDDMKRPPDAKVAREMDQKFGWEDESKVEETGYVPSADDFEKEQLVKLQELEDKINKENTPNFHRNLRTPEDNLDHLPKYMAPIPRERQVDEDGNARGTGRRKTATATIVLEEIGVDEEEMPDGMRGTPITVNGKNILDFYTNTYYREDVLAPFIVTETLGQFRVKAKVEGGGKSAQAGAMRLGIARALQNWDPDYRPPLKDAGYLKRDPRMVERKKPGLRKARKAPQWVKR